MSLSIDTLLPRTTESTRLRPFRPDDVPQFHAYRIDADLARFQGWSPMTWEQAREFVDQVAGCSRLQLGEWVQLAIADAQTDGLIGDVGVWVDADGCAAELGFTVARQAQGQGHATRAVGMVLTLLRAVGSVRSVRAVTDARNLASIRTLTRSGFDLVERRQAWFKGELCTEWVYGLVLRMDAALGSPD